MTKEEALEIARIVSQADGGCPVCVNTLIESLEASFPGLEWRHMVRKFWNGEALYDDKKEELLMKDEGPNPSWSAEKMAKYMEERFGKDILQDGRTGKPIPWKDVVKAFDYDFSVYEVDKKEEK